MHKGKKEQSVKRYAGTIHISARQMTAYWVAVTVLIIVSGLMRFNAAEPYGNINSCGLDGALVWAASKLLVLGVLPIALTIFMGSITLSQTRAICITRMKSRWHIWVEEELVLLGCTVATMAYNMFFSFVMAMGFNHGVMSWKEFTDEVLYSQTYYGISVVRYNLDTSDTFPLCRSLMLVLLVNALEIFIIVLLGNLIYWFINRRMIEVLVVCAFCIPVGVNQGKGMNILRTFGLKMADVDYYRELLDMNYTAKIGVIIVAIVLLINITAYQITKRKDFM